MEATVPHVLIWITIFSTSFGSVPFTMITEPFPTLEACQEWDKVRIAEVQSPLAIADVQTACVPADKVPGVGAPAVKKDTSV
jgi:hypothetical protein